MTKDLKEQTKASNSAFGMPSPLHADNDGPGGGASFAQPKRHSSTPRARSGARANAPDFRTVSFVAAFGAGVAGVLLLFLGMAAAFGGASDGHILTGVKAGSVDLSGLTRDEAVAKLQTGYSSLGNGQIVVTTPVGSATLTYADAGRAADAEAIADAAMGIGRSGNVLSDVITSVHAAILGDSVPVVIHVDPTVLAERIHSIVAKNSVAPKDAQASLKDGNFSFTPSSVGRGMNEPAAATTLIDTLTEISPPAQIETGGSFVDLHPSITDKDAQDAIVSAQKMVVDVTLTWGIKTWQINANIIRSWIIFGPKQDGSYGATIDPIKAEAYVSTLTASANLPPVEPSVVWGSDGKPVSLIAGKDGTGVDLVATVQGIADGLDAYAAGTAGAPKLEVTTAPIPPRLVDVTSIKGFVIIGQHTTTFFPGESNGNGVNIRLPASRINGVVVGPGQQFSFLSAVGPIDEAHGFAKGGVIVNGQSDHTGAIGGGICSASTTFFNAAFKAGLQLDERHQHAYYINRYPVGLDATVFSNGVKLYDMKWTNDTPYPIVIRSWATRGSTSSITVQLWSMPLDRTVTKTGGDKANKVEATDGKKYVINGTLAPGRTYRQEYPTEGFDTSVTRVVKDKNGVVLHTNTYISHYVKVDGLLEIGGPPPTPTPFHTPPPAATPTPTATPRRRRLVAVR